MRGKEERNKGKAERKGREERKIGEEERRGGEARQRGEEERRGRNKRKRGNGRIGRGDKNRGEEEINEEKRQTHTRAYDIRERQRISKKQRRAEKIRETIEEQRRYT